MMNAYEPAFGGKSTVMDYYQRALHEVEMKLNSMSDRKVLANDAVELTELLAGEYVLAPVLENSKQPQATQEGEFAIVKIDLVPAPSNRLVVTQLYGTIGWPVSSGIEQLCSFGPHQQMLIIRAQPQKVASLRHTIRTALASLNRDIEAQAQSYKERASHVVQQRMWQAKDRATDFEKTMTELGISIIMRDDAVEPVRIDVKREVSVLREAPQGQAGPSDVYLTPESLLQILGLVDQAGKGFELAPATFTKLDEEDLRNIIIGYLNAVFTRSAATGETFSKRGRTDIFLQVPGGPVLICECKYWNGAKHYLEGVEQLFNYLTCRHSAAVMIVFSRNKAGLSGVLTEADRAILDAGSYLDGFARPHATHRVSYHKHPADAQKSIEVHHLFFDLHS